MPDNGERRPCQELDETITRYPVEFVEPGVRIGTGESAGMLITDWNMPEMNGLELVKKVRADGRFTDLPIIMVTTEGGKAEVITALKAGVNNYIVKPFTPQVLKEKLAAVLGTEG